MLFEKLMEIKDVRREHGKKYGLGEVLMCVIIAMISGAISYRKIHTFINKKHKELKSELDLDWEKPPAYTTIRDIIQGVNKSELEQCFRDYTQSQTPGVSDRVISFDGKSVRGSFDHMDDQKAQHVLSLFDAKNKLILGQEIVSEKTNEIPVFQNIVGQFDVKNSVFTGDALHCQKKR